MILSNEIKKFIEDAITSLKSNSATSISDATELLNLASNELLTGEILEPEKITKKHFEDAPWLNTYYFNPRVNINEDIIVPFYVTDAKHSDYLLNKNTKKFQVEINFNGNTIRQRIPIGDNEINIGRCTDLGMQYFTMQVTDLSNNLKSYDHVFHLLCVDPNYKEKVYTMTENDLNTYSINNTGSELEQDMTNNIDGINLLLSDKRSAGFDKVILLPGKYTCNMGNTRDRAIVVPSGLTLDLNGSTIKQKFTTKGHASLIIKTEKDAINSHLINGSIEGDYDEHDLTVPEGASYGIEGEGYDCMMFGGAFCSVKDINMSDITGYAICGGDTIFTKGEPLDRRKFTHSYINCKGEEIECDFAMTSEIVKISHSYEFILANQYLGYGGFAGSSEIEYMHFYDSEKNYLFSKKVRQFGMVPIPEDAAYVNVTVYTNDPSTIGYGGGVQTTGGFSTEYRNFLPLTCCEFINVNCYNTRTCAVATGVFNFLLVEGCTFKKCGQWLEQGRVTPVAIDIEDGYQYGQNYFFRNNQYIPDEEGIGSDAVIVTRGHNVVFTDTNMKPDMRAVRGLLLKDTTYRGCSITRNSHMRTAFQRIINCEFTGNANFYMGVRDDGSKSPLPNTVRNCIFHSGVNYSGGSFEQCQHLTFENCTLDTTDPTNYSSQSIGKSVFKNSTILLSTIYGCNATFKNCIIKPNENGPTSDTIGLRGSFTIDDCDCYDFNISNLNVTHKSTIINSRLNNVQVNFGNLNCHFIQ